MNMSAHTLYYVLKLCLEKLLGVCQKLFVGGRIKDHLKLLLICTLVYQI